VSRMAPVDVVLAEGFKMEDFPKLEVHRPSLGKPRLWPATRGIMALATDGPAEVGLPCFDLNDTAAIAEWVAWGG
jgi:molybdopterin-guanine dinucleotide biosynthesis protein B